MTARNSFMPDDQQYHVDAQNLSAPWMRPSRGMTELNVGDVVRSGGRMAAVTDVGTVLVAITTAMGARMVCPWELVRSRTAQRDRDFGARPQ